jgi:hypothetical protein
MRVAGLVGGEPPVDCRFWNGDLWHRASLPRPTAKLKRVAVCCYHR